MFDETTPRVLPRSVPGYHARHAAHLRALAEVERDGSLKTRLLADARRHERIEARSAAVSLQDTPAAKVGRLRRCAALARRVANQTRARELYRQLLAIAMDYERMARTLEVQAAND